ncbi:MAG TPA: hypothetical protein PLF89_17060 [bacterium]|nr:hypothetical protein [bacterium]
MKTCRIYLAGVCLAASFTINCENELGLSKAKEAQIVVTVHTGLSSFEIYSIGRESAGARKIASGYEIRLSPDGKSLLYTAVKDGQMDLFVASIFGDAQPRKLTQNQFSDSDGQWSPDGATIAFQSGPDGSMNHVWIISKDGSGQRRLTTDTTGFNHTPRWAPDGARIAYRYSCLDDARIYTGQDELCIMQLDGSEKTTLLTGKFELLAWGPGTGALSLQSDGRVSLVNADLCTTRPLVQNEPDSAINEIAWSPDGVQVAFTRSADLFSIHSDGSGLQQLTHFTSGSASAVAWSGDGEEIAFAQQGALYVVRSDGSGLEHIAAPAGVREICWVPAP